MRLIGNKIRSACEMMEAEGSMSGAEMARRLGIVAQNGGKYCSRAVGLGLMTVERWEENNKKYAEYSIVPEWREIVLRQKVRKIDAQIVHEPTRWTGVNSVWGMAA